MRLHFWAARETGLFDEHPAFMDYYVRFIGHSVSVYGVARAAPRESARWSAEPANVQAYLATKQMPDVVGVSPRGVVVSAAGRGARLHRVARAVAPSASPCPPTAPRKPPSSFCVRRHKGMGTHAL